MREKENGRSIIADVDALVLRQLGQVQEKAAKTWERREQEALTTIVRALDTIAVANLLGANLGSPAEQEQARQYAKLGVVAALKPFLTKVGDIAGGIPWAPIVPEQMHFAYSYLFTCGQLVHLRRMVRLERYGLSKSTVAEVGLLIEVEVGVEEMAQRFAIEAVLAARRGDASTEEERQGWLAERMESYVDVSNGWFIRYDNDWDVVQAYRKEAEDYGSNFIEREAMPDSIKIGDRSFKEWRDASNQALGRVLRHIDFACQLRKKEPTIALANVLTIFARKDDVEAVLEEAGIPRSMVPSSMRALMLSADTVDDWDWEANFEVPCPYYIELGRDFVLLPCFGALSNPYVSFFRHLKAAYTKDWNDAVDEREGVFRRDLADALGGPRFHVPSHGFSLRRSDGSELTDIDAVIVDAEAGTLVFVQLKWNDAFGYSLSEWHSRQKNVVTTANAWIEKVVSWIDGRSAREVAKQLSIKGVTSGDAPMMYVITRYIARFSGDIDRDRRAVWLTWFELLHLFDCLNPADPLGDLSNALRRHVARFVVEHHRIVNFKFPELMVELRVIPSNGK